MRPFRPFLIAGILLATAPARAEVSEASGHADEAFDFMNLLAHHGLHDLADEQWNAYGQFTWISSYKFPFTAPYNGPNSLTPDRETSFTGTATLFFGLKLWPGAEFYEVPEMIAEKPLSGLAPGSGLKGLGSAIQNFELQKNGQVTPTPYNSRVYLRQTIGLGGGHVEQSSDPMQLGNVVDRRRIVLTVGNFSIIDFFDKNTFSGDLRQQFFNMAFLTYAAYDFAADARGYAWGGMAEIHYDDWAIRFGRFTPPKDPNQLPLDFRLYKYYGDQLEIEHAHRVFGHDGAVRILGYRNREYMARFDDAIAAYQADPAENNATTCGGPEYGSSIATAPDVCHARKPNVKVGLGINLEQHITEDAGLFFRGMVSDGQTEVYSYTSTDSSISLGALAKGSAWHRAGDTLGVGYGEGWISKAHAEYLAMGGVDGFIGDGKITQASEHVLEAFYSVNVASPFWAASPLWVSLDYQHIWNPAYNAARGPVDIVGARLHAEF